MVTDCSNNTELLLQIEAELEEISDLDEILNLDQLKQKKLTIKFKNLLTNFNNNDKMVNIILLLNNTIFI